MIGLGWKLQVNDGVADAYADINGITSLGIPDDGPVGMVEHKPLDLANSTVTRSAALVTPGAFTFSYEFTKADYIRLAALKRVQKNWKVSSTDGTPWTRIVPGILSVQTLQPVVADGVVTVDVTVEVTGAAT